MSAIGAESAHRFGTPLPTSGDGNGAMVLLPSAGANRVIDEASAQQLGLLV